MNRVVRLGPERWQGVASLKKVSRLGAAGKSGPRTGSAPRRGSNARVLRIIGGTWRGRKLRFPAAAEIRPTPDRVRETLFNWLGARTPGARCLDLFAGSGALGLEALSRGAAHVTFIERDEAAAHALRERLREWQAQDARVERQDALKYLAGAPQPFDIAFLDPPFGSALLAQAAELLVQGDWLRPDALIYVECAARAGAPAVPGSFAALKAKQAGEVGYYLFGYTPQRAL
jgi:16S rRNA (guanine966-N2)-methyltransferase